MNYFASITDFFRSPKWMMNLLFAGICVLIPIIGQIVVVGWLVMGFWGRGDEKFETFPDFDFALFGKYLEFGLWPFLVAFVSSMAFSLIAIPLFWVLMIPTILIGGISSNAQSSVGGIFAGFTMLLLMVAGLLVVIAMMIALVPLKIRASLTQDFAKAFDFGFVKQFVALTWKEIVLSTLFVMAAGVVLGGLGLVVFCVGIYFASVVVYFAWTHLYKQLYELYLTRGGDPVPISSKLIDGASAAP